MRLRIGVNLGDIIVEGSDIYGDGVNVAARLEGLAEPGGICISGKVYEEVKKKLPAAFEDLGEQEVKNISEPVRVYRWIDATADPVPGTAGAEGALPLPDKPSIAVLPFNNMSGDPEQEYFADGVTEDIITTLSRLRWLFVIARNSTFHYKGTSPDIRRVADELGVRYVLEGSVRKSGNRVRVTAQLIDARTGSHVWANRYDREIIDIFDLQDELTASIAGNVDAELASTERELSRIKQPENMDAWDHYLRGMWHAYRFSPEDTKKALRFFKSATELDPKYGPAYAGISLTHFLNALLAFSDDFGAELERAYATAKKSIECDYRNAEAHWALARAHMLREEHDQAIAEFELSISLNPNYSQGHYSLGWGLNLVDRPGEALEHLEQAYRLSPHDPLAFAFLMARSISHVLMGDLEKALEVSEQATRQQNAHFIIFAGNAAIAALADRTDILARAKNELLRQRPDFRIGLFLRAFPFEHRKHTDLFLEGLRKAGLPE
ncbi:MAG: hypothetical protein O7B24_10625 [Alphaproteobacteria bacterium]|nr:hypothetical protein [Alphaproteobacteria bacterium]